MTNVPYPALTRIKREQLTNRDNTMQYCVQEGQQKCQALRLLHLAAVLRQRAVYWGMFGFVLMAFCSAAPQERSSFSMGQGGCGR
jgi:hypothetical protein